MYWALNIFFQIADLTQNVASLETQMRQLEDQKVRAESDLNAVRDLCLKLDQQKDGLMQQLEQNESLKSQVEDSFIFILFFFQNLK